MDARERTRELLAALADGAVGPLLADDVSFRTDRGELLGRDGVVERMQARIQDEPGYQYAFGETMAKRNVAFVPWEWQGPDGKAVESGTWAMSFGRDGKVTHWTEIAASA